MLRIMGQVLRQEWRILVCALIPTVALLGGSTWHNGSLIALAWLITACHLAAAWPARPPIRVPDWVQPLCFGLIGAIWLLDPATRLHGWVRALLAGLV